jgi:hypothetical protein
MQRRAFIGGFAATAALGPMGGLAQTPGKRPLIVCLVGGSKAGTERFFGGFSQGMRELGYVEGRDYGFEVRYAEGMGERPENKTLLDMGSETQGTTWVGVTRFGLRPGRPSAIFSSGK